MQLRPGPLQFRRRIAQLFPGTTVTGPYPRARVQKLMDHRGVVMPNAADGHGSSPYTGKKSLCLFIDYRFHQPHHPLLALLFFIILSSAANINDFPATFPFSSFPYSLTIYKRWGFLLQSGEKKGTIFSIATNDKPPGDSISPTIDLLWRAGILYQTAAFPIQLAWEAIYVLL